MKKEQKTAAVALKKPLVAVDAIIEHDSRILLIKRKNKPFKDCWALPGGFIEYNESAEEAAAREAKEETGLSIKIISLLGVYSEPSRDPRGHVISICYVARCTRNAHESAKAGSDAKDAKFFYLKEIFNLKLAFDHNKIIEDYVRCKKEKRRVKCSAKSAEV